MCSGCEGFTSARSISFARNIVGNSREFIVNQHGQMHYAHMSDPFCICFLFGSTDWRMNKHRICSIERWTHCHQLGTVWNAFIRVGYPSFDKVCFVNLNGISIYMRSLITLLRGMCYWRIAEKRTRIDNYWTSFRLITENYCNNEWIVFNENAGSSRWQRRQRRYWTARIDGTTWIARYSTQSISPQLKHIIKISIHN